MTELEYQLEFDRIDLSYATKLNELDQKIRNATLHDNDLMMESLAKKNEIINMQALRSELELERKCEIAKLNDEYTASKK